VSAIAEWLIGGEAAAAEADDRSAGEAEGLAVGVEDGEFGCLIRLQANGAIIENSRTDSHAADGNRSAQRKMKAGIFRIVASGCSGGRRCGKDNLAPRRLSGRALAALRSSAAVRRAKECA
jgi:hypothetical protein